MREHEDDFNLQAVCNKLHNFYTTSAGARANASAMLSYTNTAKFEAWKGTTESFTLYWQDQTRQHESIVDSHSHFSENQKKILLESAVASVKPLRAVKCQVDQMFTHTCKLLEYDQNAIRYYFPHQLIMIHNLFLHPLEAIERFATPS